MTTKKKATKKKATKKKATKKKKVSKKENPNIKKFTLAQLREWRIPEQAECMLTTEQEDALPDTYARVIEEVSDEWDRGEWHRRVFIMQYEGVNYQLGYDYSPTSGYNDFEDGDPEDVYEGVRVESRTETRTVTTTVWEPVTTPLEKFTAWLKKELDDADYYSGEPAPGRTQALREVQAKIKELGLSPEEG